MKDRVWDFFYPFLMHSDECTEEGCKVNLKSPCVVYNLQDLIILTMGLAIPEDIEKCHHQSLKVGDF